jgi:hypothetical protein
VAGASKAMIDQLKSIGIEKGRPFSPDQRTRDVLNAAAGEAHAWLVARYEASFSSPFYEGGHWALPGSRELLEGQATFFAKPDVYPVDVRGITFSYAYFTPKHLGTGSSCGSAASRMGSVPGTDRSSRSCPTRPGAAS